MKIIFSVIFFVILSAGYLQPQKKNDMQISKIIEEIRAKYAPDKRTAIFHVLAEKQGNLIKLSGETNIPTAVEELMQRLGKYELQNEITILPSKELGGKIYGVVNLSVANLRTEPKHTAEMATQALLGTPIKVLKKTKDNWFLVQTPDEYIAWMDNDGFHLMDESSLNNWTHSPRVIFMLNSGSSFISPDLNSEKVSDLVEGNILKFLGEESAFTKIKYPDSRTAFIQKSSVVDLKNWLESLHPANQDIIATAKTYMGIPYLWGGTSPKGFDCSGFTKTVYYLNGILLPRDASQQVHIGELVDTRQGFDKLLPGDLLFFGSKAAGEKPERITHVGIYIGGNEYIHAAGRVKINSLDRSKQNFNQYRFNTFIRAKRILSSVDKNGVVSLMTHKFYSN